MSHYCRVPACPWKITVISQNRKKWLIETMARTFSIIWEKTLRISRKSVSLGVSYNFNYLKNLRYHLSIPGRCKKIANFESPFKNQQCPEFRKLKKDINIVLRDLTGLDTSVESKKCEQMIEVRVTAIQLTRQMPIVQVRTFSPFFWKWIFRLNQQNLH